MCGILGLIGTPWRESARAALAALERRGPDDSGWFDRPPVLLGHRRLSVIDLISGHQPMSQTDGRYTVVFNGEIYNFLELRDALVAAGCHFATHSDTEVLLHGYARWGPGIAPRLDGMFAFAIWDAQEQRLFAARDRLGIKPFFYATISGLAFASTLEPFFHLEGFPRRLDYEALRDYLAGQTVLAPHSMLRAVRQLPPAHWLMHEAATGTTRVQRYWSIPEPRPTTLSHDDILTQTDEALTRSVRRQLIADVPLGAFLSGGIDSGLMVHYMAAAGAQPLKTFNMRFAEERFDESRFAQAVAAHYGTTHQVIDAPTLGEEPFLAAIAALDQPLADPAYLPTCELSHQMRGHITVAISGDGGDELFGGYARFLDVAANHPATPWKSAMRRLVEAGILPGSLLRRTLSGSDLLFYRRVELGPYAQSRKSMKRYLAPATWAQCHPERTLGLWTDLIRSFGGRYDTDSLMRADLWTYLSENCLVKTDRASMAHSLEVRVPMLGNEVLDATLPLPAAVHFQAQDKAILRALAQRHLPPGIWDRPKHGFSMPLRSFFTGAWHPVCEDTFAKTAAVAPFLDAPAVTDLWRRARDGKASLRLAYTFLVLLLWLERHPVSD